MILTIEDFIREFEIIRDKGWIKTHRLGPTGIGKTLEDLLGIVENNDDTPDFGEYELKSSRTSSNSMLTLFTRAPKPARSNTYLRAKYGYSSSSYDNESKVLHATLSANRYVPIQNTGKFLKITCDEEKIFIESKEEKENVYWPYELLKTAFMRKYKNKLVYVKADSRGSGASEEFHFKEAYEIFDFDFHLMINLLKIGKIYVDLRIGQYSDGRTHDHGTGFRIREQDQPLLFHTIKRIV